MFLISIFPVPILEFQPMFPGGITKCFDPAVEPETGTIESNLRDPGRPGIFGNELSHLGCGGNVTAILQTGTEFGVDRRCTGYHASTNIVDNLGIDMPGRAKYAQPLNAKIFYLVTYLARTS